VVETSVSIICVSVATVSGLRQMTNYEIPNTEGMPKHEYLKNACFSGRKVRHLDFGFLSSLGISSFVPCLTEGGAEFGLDLGVGFFGLVCLENVVCFVGVELAECPDAGGADEGFGVLEAFAECG